MTQVKGLHRKWMQDPAYRQAYDELAPEFELARSIISARLAAGLTQEELAERMQTTQSVIARLEGGRVWPSTRTLDRFAQATGTRLKISFEPVAAAE
jgi:transcriptional regulator with XRE-family HTH domain